MEQFGQKGKTIFKNFCVVEIILILSLSEGVRVCEEIHCTDPSAECA